MEEISTYGVEFKNEVGGQIFFADGYWGMSRYLNNDRFNIAHHNEDIGDNFSYGTKCSGTVKASEATLPSIPGQQLAYNAINTITTVSLNENAKCIVSGEYAAIFNSGWSTSSNSTLLDSQNNYQEIFVAAGMSYTVSETNSFQVLATVTGTDYSDRQSTIEVAGLVNKLTTDQVMATYTKNLSPSLALNAQLGVIGVRDNYLSLEIPKTILPQYSFNVQWALTPKLGLNVAASRSATPPTSVISNLQITDSVSAGINYNYTPKISLSGNVQASYATSAATLLVSNPLLAPYASNQKTYGAGAKMSYSITPFIAADLSYKYYKTLQANLTTNTSVIMLALNFNPLLSLRIWSATMRTILQMVRTRILSFAALALRGLSERSGLRGGRPPPEQIRRGDDESRQPAGHGYDLAS